MAYGVTTRIYLETEPRRPRNSEEQSSVIWRLLHAEERLRAVERMLKTAA